jgi:hypothetical protein
MGVRHLTAVLCLLVIAGCGGKKEADKRTASGEVLEGTISDKMLPLATVTSQPPRLKDQPSDSDEADTGEATDSDGPGDAPPIAGNGAN